MSQITSSKMSRHQVIRPRWFSKQISWQKENFAPGAYKRHAPQQADRPHVKIKTWSGPPPVYKPHYARGRLVIPPRPRDHFCENFTFRTRECHGLTVMSALSRKSADHMPRERSQSATYASMKVDGHICPPHGGSPIMGRSMHRAEEACKKATYAPHMGEAPLWG